MIGYGNIHRADDGVAHVIVNELRRRLRQNELPDDETGLSGLGRSIDSVFLLQLTPELIDIIVRYEGVVFVDAHVYDNVEPVLCHPVIPEKTSLTFTHHMSPSMLMALAAELLNLRPEGYLVSVRGHDFDFRRGLSAETMRHVKPAVEAIMTWINSRGHNT